uniref:Calponin-homology (CH) domain-containing protein n=1 Tax=Poecilia latipinna TaxID=48699 RepID=A0A3B3U496_9TELE
MCGLCCFLVCCVNKCLLFFCPMSSCLPVLPLQAATGKSFGDKDFRSALENGILLCELLSAIKPGLVKKINRLPTPIAGLFRNAELFL